MNNDDTAYSILVNGVEHTIGNHVTIGRNKTTWTIAYFHKDRRGVSLFNPLTGRTRDASITELRKAE